MGTRSPPHKITLKVQLVRQKPCTPLQDAANQSTVCVPSNGDLGHFGKAHIVAAAIIEAGGFRIRVPGHALRDLDTPAVR
jgi:precorrin-3B methylase